MTSFSGRQILIRSAVAQIFDDLSGIDPASVPSDVSFLEMGLDSLILTQVSQTLNNRLGAKVAFRQLLGEESTLDRLTQFLETHIDKARFAEPAHATLPAVIEAPAATPLPAPHSLTLDENGSDPGSNQSIPSLGAFESILREQLQAMNQLMARQLEALRGTGSLASKPAATQAIAQPDSTGIAERAPASEPAPASVEFKPFGPYKPVQKGPTGGLTGQQERYLAAFIERYNRRTARSKSMTQKHRQKLADPRVASGFRSQWKEIVYPIVTTRSNGARLWDVDGNEYVDILNGFGPTFLGHAPGFVTQAVRDQLDLGFEIGPQSPLAGEVASMICEFTGMERATFCNTGSEAVTAAIRVSRTVTGRNRIVVFAGAYHGMFDEVLVKGAHGTSGPRTFPIAPGIPREKVENVTVLDYGAPSSLDWIKEHAQELAAVLVEPVQSRHPALQPVEFLRELRSITAASGTALIFDEVVTGFRVHPGGVQALFGIRADLATYGKVIGGGLPIGILAGSSQFMDALDGGFWQYGDESSPEKGVTFFAGTFVRHPLALAAVKAVLIHLREQGPQLQERLNERTGELAGSLNECFEQSGLPVRVEHFGSIFYFTFPGDLRFASLFYYHLREKGVHVQEGFPCFLTTAHGDEEVRRIVAAFRESIREMQDGGLFPAPDRTPSEEFVAPMTEPQREIWLAAHVDDEASCAFNESLTLSLRGQLNEPALKEALNILIARHEALRATVSPEADNLRFVPTLEADLPLVDLSGLDYDVREATYRKMLARDASTPFDLANGPLLRTTLLRMEPDLHLLVFTAHHLVCDGWSTNVVLNELAQLYSARRKKIHALLTPPVRFSEYARDEKMRGSSAEHEKVEAYWLERFQPPPPPLNLPLDHPRPSVKSYSGATIRKTIPVANTEQIKRLGFQNGCTLFVTLLAGFHALLHRLSGQRQIVTGIPSAGQSLLDNGALVGHCVNFLPLASQCSGEKRFTDLLKELKAEVLDAYDHQSYTYGTLVRKLGLRRDPGRLPLIEIQFNLERVGEKLAFEGLEASVDPNPKSAVNFDLFFNIVECGDGLKIDCDFNTVLFDHATIERWMKHYETLLLGAAAGATVALDDLPLMNREELGALIASWNPSPAEYPVQSPLHRLFEERAAQNPDAIAVSMGAEHATYRELNVRANRLAHLLQRKGVKPNALVAICFERSIDMITSFLAVLKAGGAYVPVDSSYPSGRLRMMLEDARPSLIVTQDKLAAVLPETGAEIVRIDKDWPLIAAEDAENPNSAAGPEDSAYVIYTSGSTGVPKGVTVTHANVVRLLKAAEPWFQFGERDVWSLFHTYSFDVSVWEIWGCLSSGGRLVIIPFWVTRSPQELYSLIAKEKVTVLCQIPVAFYQLIQVEESGGAEPLALRYVILAGEALNFAMLQPWVKRHGANTPLIVNMYGPTEATVYATYRPLTAADIESETRSLIGVPLPDMRTYFLDAGGRPVPVGVTGELYLGGAGVARGYLNRPEMTAERFVPDPFASVNGARMYRTGDLARFLSSGDIDFLGRADSQVKIHGFRIELGEIEAALAAHNGVSEAVVAVCASTSGDKKLVAYFVPKPGEVVAASVLREFLQTKLPAHMVPYAYLPIDSVPLNPNGKVNREALPAPTSGAAAPAHEYVAPRTPQEEILAGILAEVLRVEKVGISDDFFELGADSLHVFQITSRAAKAGLSITPRLLLEHRTIESVLAAMDRTPVRAAKPVPAIVPVARQKYRVTREPSLTNR